MKRHLLCGCVLMLLCNGAAQGREEIRIVGSSPVLPFVQAVSDNFILHWNHPAPSLEITGTGQGFRLFCAGIGFEHPDVVATSRNISDAELASCNSNGVQDVSEIAVGLESLVVVNRNASPQYSFSIPQLYAGLAAKVEQDGRVIDNPYQNWSAIDPSLPDVAIEVTGPPPTDPFHIAIMALIMKEGCKAYPAIAGLDDSRQVTACYSMRRDGHYRFGSRNIQELADWLSETPHGFAIVPHSWIRQLPGVAPNAVGGVMPTIVNMADGAYPLTRSIRLYVKTKHVNAIDGFQQFLYEFTSERAIGPNGYLLERGFIPMDDIGRNHARDMALSLETIERHAE